MSREGKLAKNTFILAIGTFLPRLATFVILPIMTGGLTKEEYGTYDLMLVLVLLLLPAVTMQIHAAAFRFIIDVKKDRQKCSSIITNIFAVIIPTSLLALMFLFLCLPRYDFQIRTLFCTYLFVDILTTACQWVIRGLQQNLKYSVSAILNSLGRMIFSSLFVWWLHLGLAGAITSLIVADTISLVYLLFAGKIFHYIDFRFVSKTEIRSMLAYSWPLVPNNMSMWVMRVSDRFVVTMFMGVAANAVYAVANKIPQILAVAQSTFTMAWQENASVTSGDEDADQYYSVMFRRMYDLMAGAMGLLVAMTPVLFRLLIRGDYREAYNQIPVLFMAMFFSTLSSYLGGIYVAYKATKSIGITTLVAAICNLVVDFALIRLIGLFAASGSTLISYILLFVYRMKDVRRLVDISYDIRHMLIVLGLLIVECALCFMQKTAFNVINIGLGTIVFILLNRELIGILLGKAKRILRRA